MILKNKAFSGSGILKNHTTMQKSQILVQKKMPEFEERLKRAMADLEGKFKRKTSREGSTQNVGQGRNGQIMPATREAKWNTLVGTWFGTLDARGRGKYMWISEENNDGTYKTRFRIIDASGNTKEQTEIGEWGVSGDVKFKILKTVIKGDKTITVNPREPGFRDGYRILQLTNDVFVYECRGPWYIPTLEPLGPR